MKLDKYYTKIHGVDVGATIFLAPNRALADTQPTLFYFHGGGLIYGSRLDLPQTYLNQLQAAGFDLIALDYPLIPECHLDTILNCLISGINWGLDELQTLTYKKKNNYLLFGRSAGAYLALLLSSSLYQERLDRKPCGVISFYGYYSLLDRGLLSPSYYYQQYPTLPDQMILPLIKKEPITSALIEQRFPLYLAYRQTGKWVTNILGPNLNATDFSLTDGQLVTLPPVFIAASTGDQDVPFHYSKELHDKLPNSQFYQVNQLPHDFDRDTTNPVGKDAYQAMINWINTHVS